MQRYIQPQPLSILRPLGVWSRNVQRSHEHGCACHLVTLGWRHIRSSLAVVLMPASSGRC
jgi:hypothetical protein